MKIIVRAPNWLGDVVISLPALRALCTAYPDAVVTVLAHRSVAPLYELVKEIDAVAAFDLKSGMGKKTAAQWLRDGGFDLGLLLTRSFSSAWLFWCGDVEERAGFAGQCRNWILTTSLPAPDRDDGRHQVYHYLDLVELVTGEKPGELDFSLTPDGASEKAADALWTGHGLAAKKVFAVHPGATYGPAKRWPAEKFRVTVDRIARESGAVPLLLAGPGEGEEARQAVPPTAIDLSEHLSLKELLAVLKRSMFLLCNDSGPMHLAAAVGTPAVAIFSSTSPVATGPLGAGHKVITSSAPCRPCFARHCQKDYYCQNLIKPDEVVAASLQLL